MKISYKGDYALKALLFLAGKYEKSQSVKIQEISSQLDIPLKFLEQILIELKRAGYIVSKRGAYGGYSMKKSPESIYLGEIVRLIDGPLAPIACVSKAGYSNCSDLGTCVFEPIWADVRNAVSSIVDSITFQNLLDKQKNKVFHKFTELAKDLAPNK